jgi:hypothetical protein
MYRPAKDYFVEPSLTRSALASYARQSAMFGWPITHKLDLYNAAKTAFGDGARTEAERRRAFATIYENLRTYWQVFRPFGPHWNDSEVFDAISTRMAQYSRDTGMTLVTLEGSSSGVLFDALNSLRPLKPMKWYPGMAVSKFLHFFNPSLFPIYDNEVVEKKVLKRFYSGYCNEFVPSSGFNTARHKDVYFLRYTFWARSLVLPAADTFMRSFAEWFREQVNGHPDPEGVLDDLESYYATAYEFVVIGGAYMR